eukprot:2122716-Rhodomonas_salina.1
MHAEKPSLRAGASSRGLRGAAVGASVESCESRVEGALRTESSDSWPSRLAMVCRVLERSCWRVSACWLAASIADTHSCISADVVDAPPAPHRTRSKRSHSGSHSE